MAAASLDNTGSIHLRGSSANQALLDVTGAAGFGTAGTLTGTVDLTQDSAIEFQSGQISTIGASSQLTLDGSNAVIEDGASGSNSALSGLTNVAGSLYLASGASLSTGALTNNGLLGMDLEFNSGGSAFSVAGGLTNNGTLYIGVGAGGLSATDTLTVDTLSNANAGVIGLYGNGNNQALLDVTTGVAGFGTAGTVTGTVNSRPGFCDRIPERADHHDRRRWGFGPHGGQCVHRGRRDGLEQRADRARQHQGLRLPLSRRRGRGVDGRPAHQQRLSRR